MSLPYPPCDGCGCPDNYHEKDFDTGTKKCLLHNRRCGDTRTVVSVKGVKLNLGCGRHPEPGWVNVDVRPGDGVDILADLDGDDCLAAFATDSVEHIRALGLLEHLPHWENLVMESARVLKPGGVFEIRVPYRMDYVAYHVRHFDKNTFNPYRSDYRPRELDFVRRKHAWGSLEFREPYFTLAKKWIEHWVPFSWHAHKYLGIDASRWPLGRRLNLHINLRRNDTPWTSS